MYPSMSEEDVRFIEAMVGKICAHLDRISKELATLGKARTEPEASALLHLDLEATDNEEDVFGPGNSENYGSST